MVGRRKVSHVHEGIRCVAVRATKEGAANVWAVCVENMKSIMTSEVLPVIFNGTEEQAADFVKQRAMVGYAAYVARQLKYSEGVYEENFVADFFRGCD